MDRPFAKAPVEDEGIVPSKEIDRLVLKAIRAVDILAAPASCQLSGDHPALAGGETPHDSRWDGGATKLKEFTRRL
jgi:hypothetical protein